MSAGSALHRGKAEIRPRVCVELGSQNALGLFLRDQILRLSAMPVVADWITRRLVSDSFVLPD
jgi:hypothetical protein